MKLWSRGIIAAAAGVAVAGVIGVAMAGRAAAQGQGKAAEPAKPAAAAAPAAAASGKPTSGEFFKNVTTSTLKPLTPDDFIASMGVMAAALGWDCADCHPGAGTDKADWVTDSDAHKKTARRMVEMVAAINKTNFAGAQMVTCWTCHHGRDIPATTIALDNLYSNPNNEKDDVLQVVPGQPAATQVLDKYIQALGGAQKLNALTSYVMTGQSLGYEGLGGTGEFTVYAKAPDMRATNIHFKEHPERGNSIWTFDGKTGWVAVPRGLLGEYELLGNDVDATRIEAQMSFPGQIKTILRNFRVGVEGIGDKDYQVVQGSGPRGLLVTMYFDKQTGLLARVLRFTPSPVGRIVTQVDYSNYKEINGVKFPMDIAFLWLDGRWNAKITDVKTNVAIDPKVFGKP